MTARVMVSALVAEEHVEAFEHAYAEVTGHVAGTRGHISDELLRDRTQPGRYILLSEWDSVEDFLAWENRPIHRETTTPMRPYWSVIERSIFEVA